MPNDIITDLSNLLVGGINGFSPVRSDCTLMPFLQVPLYMHVGTLLWDPKFA